MLKYSEMHAKISKILGTTCNDPVTPFLRKHLISKCLYRLFLFFYFVNKNSKTTF